MPGRLHLATPLVDAVAPGLLGRYLARIGYDSRQDRTRTGPRRRQRRGRVDAVLTVGAGVPAARRLTRR
jgi:hypothetical protein